jgi:ParB family transcriptional regulator, chromosome partitioning protein
MKPTQMVPLHRIDLSDQTFSVNFMPDLEKLRASIEEVGLIQSVLLKEKPDGYRIVSGFRRIAAVRELGHPGIDSRIAGEETEDLKLFFISLHENLTSRGFNTVEKAMALDKLVHLFKVDPGVVIRDYLPLFDLETNEKILNTFLTLAGMEEDLKRYVLIEEVSRTNIRRLAALNVEDRKGALTLLTALRLGENSLRETLTLLEEISQRDRCGIKGITDLPEIQALISHPELTPTQKTEKVKKVLMDLRYPRMSHLEEQFEKKRRDLNLPSSISFHHHPYFEGKGLRIGFQFQSMEEYRSIVSSLSALGEKRGLKEMMEDSSPPPSPPGEEKWRSGGSK